MESRLKPSRRGLLAMLCAAPLVPAAAPAIAPVDVMLTTASLDAAIAKIRLMARGDMIWSGVIVRELA